MNWIKQNTFLSGLLAVVIIGAAILGYFFVKARGQYVDAEARLEEAYIAKENLERKVPFPNDENAAKLREVVTNYRTKAELFTNKMYQAQAEMPAGVRESRFREDLALNVDAVVKAAAQAGVELRETFYLGMEKYRTQPPPEDAVDRLQYQLNATVHLINLLFANEVIKFGINRESFEVADQAPVMRGRDRPAGRDRRARGPADEMEEEKPVSESYPMEIVFEIPPRGFQNVMNTLSNTAEALAEGQPALEGDQPGEYYFVTRWMRVENERLVGPDRTDPSDEDSRPPVDDTEATPFADGGGESLNMVFGTENVRAYLALDLVRFIKPKADAAAAN